MISCGYVGQLSICHSHNSLPFSIFYFIFLNQAFSQKKKKLVSNIIEC